MRQLKPLTAGRRGAVQVVRDDQSGHDGERFDRLIAIRLAACVVAIASCLPYAALKLAWLLGSSVGSATAADAAELHDGRHVVGNVLTLAMALGAVLLAVALTHRRGQTLPAAVVMLPVWVGTGLLAPVALGLPLGIVAQAIAGGATASVDSGLEGWVYAVVYGGFTVQALALLTSFALYARVRWPELFERRTPAHGRTRRFLRADGGVAAAVVYGLANLAWAVAGERLAAPPDFDTAAQRSLLVSTGLLAFAGAAAVSALLHGPTDRRAMSPLLVPLALAWVGSAACFASGFAQYGLAAEDLNAVTTLVLALGSVAGLILARAALSRTIAIRRRARASR